MHCMFCADPEDLGGVKAYDTCETLDGQPCLPCQQYLELEAQKLVLKETFANILIQQRKLRTEINHCHDPVIRQLPLEMLTSIFEFYTDDSDTDIGLKFSDKDFTFEAEDEDWDTTNKCPALTLGAVCHTWRSIAWSSPQLWKNISIRLTDPEDRLCVEVAEECLSRSGEHPLSIHMSCYIPDTEPGPEPEKGFRRLISMINQFSSCWENLCIYCSPELVPLFSADSHGAPILRRLYLGHPASWEIGDYDEDHNDSSFMVSSLKPSQPSHVVILRRNLNSLNIDWSKITNARFPDTVVYLDQCVELLRHAPHLVELHIPCGSDPRETYQFPIHDSPIVHHKLQSLRIGDYMGVALGLFCSSFVFPTLTHLSIDVFVESDLDCFTDLITRSSCRLSFLKLHDVRYNLETLLRLIRKVPFLRELEISICTPMDSDSLDFFQLLAIDSTSNTSNGSQELLLPILQSIQYFEEGIVSWGPSFWTLIPDILWSRWHKHVTHTIHPLNKIQSTSWLPKAEPPICKDKNVVLRLAELLKLGFKFNLVYNNLDLLELSMRHHGIMTRQDSDGQDL